MSGPQKGKERLRCSLQKSEPPSEAAALNPEKKRKRQGYGKIQSQKQGLHLQGLDSAQGPGTALSKVRSAMGNTAKTPEAKGQTPHLRRKPWGRRPELEAVGQEEFEPPTMSFEAYLTYDQPPSRKRRRSGKTPATALPGESLAKRDSSGAKAEAGKSHKPPPPAPARPPMSVVPPAPAPGSAMPGLGPCQPCDPPLSAFPGTSSFQPTPRALPAPRQEEGAGPMGVRLSSRSQGFSGRKRARRSRKLSLLMQCVQTLQDSVYLLSQARGVPCPAFQPALASDTPDQPPDLEEPHGAPAVETHLFRKEHRQPALEKDTREEHKSLSEPQDQEVAEQGLQISANRPSAPLPEMAFSASSGPGGERAALNPEKKRKRQVSGKIQSHMQGRHLQGLDSAQRPGAALSKVRSAMGNTAKTPQAKGQTPHLGRKPWGPRPELEAAGQEEFEPPTMSFEAYLTYDQPPARKKRRRGKTPATALPGESLAKEDSSGAKAEAGKSHKPLPPAPARAPMSVVPPAPALRPPLLGLGPCQPSNAPLSAFPGTSSFQPTPRALPELRQEEGVGPMGVQSLQDSVYLLSQARGVPCPAFEPDLGSEAPEQPPDLEEPHGAPAVETHPFRKEHRQPALEKDTREEHKSLREPQDQEVAEQVLQISANRPSAPLPEMAFSASSGPGRAGAVQENVRPAPSPTTSTPGAPSGPARSLTGHPIPAKQALSSHKKPFKKPAPLMAKSIRDYKNRYSRR